LHDAESGGVHGGLRLLHHNRRLEVHTGLGLGSVYRTIYPEWICLTPLIVSLWRRSVSIALSLH
jgi:hypothetical protein